MNDQMISLLEKLAAQLGTTSKFLWAVLVKQAPISATNSLVYILIVAATFIILLKLHTRFLKLRQQKNSFDKTFYEENESVGWIMIIAGIIWAFMFFGALIELPNVINGYFNPEYWALDKILNACK